MMTGHDADAPNISEQACSCGQQGDTESHLMGLDSKDHEVIYPESSIYQPDKKTYMWNQPAA